MSARGLTNKDGVPAIVKLVDKQGLESVAVDADSLLRFASEALRYGEHSLFAMLPAAIDRIIERKLWKERDPPFPNFGKMAIHPAGLGVTNNRALALLRSAMDVDGRHVEAWADVLGAVQGAVKIHVRETGKSAAYMRKHADEFGDRLSYEPGENSIDGQLLNLRETDRTTFRQVVGGQTSLRNAIRARRVPKPGARLERMKASWSKASSAERKRFLTWLESSED